MRDYPDWMYHVAIGFVVGIVLFSDSIADLIMEVL
jgi:hypothetical protein